MDESFYIQSRSIDATICNPCGPDGTHSSSSSWVDISAEVILRCNNRRSPKLRFHLCSSKMLCSINNSLLKLHPHIHQLQQFIHPSSSSEPPQPTVQLEVKITNPLPLNPEEMVQKLQNDFKEEEHSQEVPRHASTSNSTDTTCSYHSVTTTTGATRRPTNLPTFHDHLSQFVALAHQSTSGPNTVRINDLSPPNSLLVHHEVTLPDENTYTTSTTLEWTPLRPEIIPIPVLKMTLVMLGLILKKDHGRYDLWDQSGHYDKSDYNDPQSRGVGC